MSSQYGGPNQTGKPLVGPWSASAVEASSALAVYLAATGLLLGASILGVRLRAYVDSLPP